MAEEIKVKRPVFMVSHTIDSLGVPGSSQVNASGVRFDLPLASGSTPYIDRVDIRNVAITAGSASTFRVNFFHSDTRGGTIYTDSTYIGGLSIVTASGVPEVYGGRYVSPGLVPSGICYGNAFNSTYGDGVSCYLPYVDNDHTARSNDINQTNYIHCTIQNIGSTQANPVKITILYELANASIL